MHEKRKGTPLKRMKKKEKKRTKDGGMEFKKGH